MLPEKTETRLLWLLAALYALLFIAFWPPLTTTMDESAYLGFAYVLRQGTFYSDIAGITTPMYITAGQHVTIKYPPGMSVYLAALAGISWNVALGANLLVHLATFFTVARLLRLAGASAIFAVFYLLHPTAVIYSRTLMSDPLGGLLVALAFLALVQKKPVLAGTTLGLAVLVKTANGFTLGLFALGLLGEALLPWKPRSPKELLTLALPAIRLVLGALPLMVVAYVYQKTVQEGGWAKYSGPGQFTLGYFVQHLPFYLVALLVVFPGMLVGLIAYKGPRRGPLWLAVAGIVAFYSAYYYLDSTGSKVESFILGQRFLLAVLPLVVVAYGAWLQRLIGQRKVLVPFAALVLALLLGAAAVQAKHQSNLKKLVQIQQEVAAKVPEKAALACNVHVGKLLHPAWTGKRAYLMIEGGGWLESDLAHVAQRVRVAPVFVALWSRDYRTETSAEQELWRALHARFEAHDLPTRVEGLQLTELVAEKNQAR